MKKITLIASALLLTVVQAFAQKEFKLAKSSGKLVINNIPNLKVEGYDGKEIIFSAATKKNGKTEDPRAAGLSALSSSGFDNTGIGISVTEKESVAIVSPVERDVKLTVKLPQGVALSIKTSGFAHGDSTVIVLNNLKSEIDASTQYENFNLTNVTGPISLKSLYGNIEGKLTPSFKGPISLVSVYGFIDVTVPDQAKANLTISSQYENLYAAKDLKLVMDENPVRVSAEGQNVQVYTVDGFSTSTSTSTTTSAKSKSKTTTTTSESSAAPLAATVPTPPNPEKPAAPRKTTTIVGDGVFNFAASPSVFSYAFGGSTVNGKLNGGGEKIVLKSTYGKIYLRK
ncbi:MAG: hypothetical protein REI64_02670 [Pedobacter sp.]|uniref:hypothetical protein n=1 Tax=Pedobacter sp. TaxID=1411316 RepID=UPI002807FB0B|nr:hypothetical protein [Pedobacter sp.]MDQ8003673.1 hypothetical protein [Pedobacter sp.]